MGSLGSSNVETRVEVPDPALNTHSWVFSGLEANMAVMSWMEYRRE
jgi:hypothetical protein